MNQPVTRKTSVVIIGAGPTGLSLAAQLLRYHIDFIIIEKNKTTTLLSKALVVQARTVEIFSEIGVAEKAIQEGKLTTAMNLFYKGRQKAFINIAGIGDGMSDYPFALSLEQSKTEKLLVDHLHTKGIKIEWQSEFISVDQHDNSVDVYYNNSSGIKQKIEASYLVGCDGAGSLIRHQLGLTFDGDTVPKLFYVADVKLVSDVITKNELYMFMIKKGFVLFFPMEGAGHYRIIGILPDHIHVDEQLNFEAIKNTIIDQVNVSLAFENVIWFSSYKVHSRKANSFENGRCYIAGDAAHIHTPAGGQGMNTGIQDAYNLAWKMAYTLNGFVNHNLLKTYNSERMENARHLLKTTDRMFDIMSGANAFWNFIRLHILTKIIGFLLKNTAVKKQIFPILSQIGITYLDEYLTIQSTVGKVKAGVRMPYLIFSDGKQIGHYIAEPNFKILFFGSDEIDPSTQLNALKFKVITHTFKEIPATLFGHQSDFYILLRPDNHISYIGKDINKCVELLTKISKK